VKIQEKYDFPTWKIGLKNGFSHKKLGFFQRSGYQIHEKLLKIAEKLLKIMHF
jgi:hypothetical protein